MIDTVKLIYKLSFNEMEELKKRFNCQTIKNSNNNILSNKYFLNMGFGYSLRDKNDLIPFYHLVIDGSIPKNLKGNNYQNHTYNDSDVVRFYDIIENDIGIRLTESDLRFISRFDVGINLEGIDTSFVSSTLMRLSIGRMNKQLVGSTCRIGNKTRQLRSYDKGQEIIDKCTNKEEKCRLKIFFKKNKVCRIETQLVKTRNIKSKFGISTINQLLSRHIQRDVFMNTYSKIVDDDRIYFMSNKNNLTLKEYGELMELQNAVNIFGDLELYRKHLLLKGYDSGNVSRKVSRLRKLNEYLDIENLKSLNQVVIDEIDKIIKS